jgi:hypothetical protein
MKKLLTFLIVPLLALMGVNAQTDVTSTYLLNPSFESATSVSTTIESWTNAGTVKLQSQNNTSFAKEGTWYAEKLQSSGNLTGIRLSQQVATIPNGWYLLKAAAFTNQNAGGAFVYANSDSTEVFGTGDYSVLVNITAGTLEVGFKVKKSSNWVACDNFRLYAIESTPYMLTGLSTLMFDAANLTKKFTVRAVNLTGNITLTAPAGITLDKTTITPAEAVAGVVVTATYNGSVNITDGLITLTSGTLTSNVTVNATNADSGCFTPLYTNRPNIISDPLMNSLSAYAGWGTKEVSKEYVFCGTSSVKIVGRCGGSLDYGLTGKLKPKTMYRVKVMVSTNGTGEAKVGIDGALAGGTKIIKPFTTDMGEWKALEFSFTTQATLGTVLMYINSCETQTATEIYVDNWEMYELFDAPTLSVEPSQLLFDALNPQRTFTVTGANLISDITLTPPTGITLDKTTLTAAEATSGAVVTAEYDFAAPIVNDSIKLTGSSVVGKVSVDAFNGVEGCYNMLYDDKTNLVSDPLMNSLSTYGGWGNRSISTEGFCNNAGFINGTATGYPNSGSIDARITWKPFTKYRIYAMVRTENGTMTLGVSNVGLGGDKNFVVPMTNGTWQQFDETFTTGATAGEGLCFFNGYAGTGYIGYIDNWQIYELNDPNIVVDPISLDFDPQFTTSSLKVIGQNLTNDITLTAPAGITLDKSTLTATEASGAGATVNATYNVSVPVVGGEITLTSGSLTKTVPVNASKYLVNPSFERDIAQGWTTNEGGMVRQSNASFTLKSGTNYAEKWISSGGALAGINLSQTVLGIPNGTYTLKASAQAIQQSDGTFPGGAFIFANANQVEVFETKEYSVDVTVTDETLNVGFKVVSSGNWVSLDNFKLISTATGLNNKYSLTGVNTFILNNRIQADINLDNTAVTQIKVYGVNGIKLAEKAVNLQAGLNRVTIDKELTRGVYLVEINVGGKFATFKLVK